jgi:hypothetical protein
MISLINYYFLNENEYVNPFDDDTGAFVALKSDYRGSDIMLWFFKHNTMNVGFNHVFLTWFVSIAINSLFLHFINFNYYNMHERHLNYIYGRWVCYYIMNLFLLPCITLFDDIGIARNYILFTDLAYIVFVGAIVKYDYGVILVPFVNFIILTFLTQFVMSLA